MRQPTPEQIARAAQRRAAAAAANDGRIAVPEGPRPVASLSLGRLAASAGGQQQRQAEGENGEGEGGPRHIQGHASVTGVAYTMYDYFGPYEETVLVGAFESTLKRSPDVVLNFSHEGLPIARTLKAKTLSLVEGRYGPVLFCPRARHHKAPRFA